MLTCSSSKALTTPGSSALAASLKITSRPGDSSMSLNWLRGMICTFSGLGWPKPCSGAIGRLRWSPPLRPKRACSKPGSRLPSPTLKVAGDLSKVLSTTSPLSSLIAKCRVTWLLLAMRISVMSGLFGLLRFEHIQRQEDGAHGDSAVGQVERWEVPTVLPVHKDEVDNMAVGHAIKQIPQGPTKNQRQRQRQPGFIGLQALEPNHQHTTDHQGDGREEPALPAVRVSEKTEGRAGVVGQGPAEVIGDQHDLLIQRQSALEVQLAQLIQHKHQHTQAQPRQFAEATSLLQAAIMHSDEPRQRHRCSRYSGRTTADGPRAGQHLHGDASSARTCYGPT